MRFGILILGVILNIACDPGTTSSSSTPQDAQDLKAKTEALSEKLGRFDKKFAKNKSSIEKAQASYADIDAIDASDLKGKSELLLDARLAEAFLADELQEFDDAKLKSLEVQITKALKQNPDDDELKETDRKAKELRVKFDKTKEELNKVRAIRRDLQKKEDAIVKDAFDAAPGLANLKDANEKVTETKAKLDKATQALASLGSSDKVNQAIVDLKAALTTDDLKKAALEATIPAQVVDQTIKNKSRDLKDLKKALVKEIETIVMEQKVDFKDKLAKKQKDLADVEALIATKTRKTKGESEVAMLQKELDVAEAGVRNFKLSGLGVKWDDADKKEFLRLVKPFADLLLPGYDGLDDLITATREFQKIDVGNKAALDAQQNKIQKYVRNIRSDIKYDHKDIENKKIEIERIQRDIVNQNDDFDKKIANARANKSEGDLKPDVSWDELNTLDKLTEAADRISNTLGTTTRPRIRAIFAVDLEGQRDVLVNAAQVIKGNLDNNLTTAQKTKDDAQIAYTDALTDLNKVKSAVGPTDAAAALKAQKDMAKFLLEANIMKLVSLLNKPNKGENAKLINLIAHDMVSRVNKRGELRRAFILTDEPIAALIQALKDQRAVWSYRDPARFFPKAMNNMITALETLLVKGEHAKDPMADLIILQSSLAKLK